LVRPEDLYRFRSVKPWLESRKEGDGRVSAMYRFAAFLRWRRVQGFSVDPDEWIEECLNGNNLTLVRHLNVVRGWLESELFDGPKDATREKYYRVIRSFYAYNLTPLPRARLRPRGMDTAVPRHVTATEFLEMAGKVVNYGGVSVRDRSVIMVMLQSGMDASTLTNVFNYVGFPQLAAHFGSEDWSRWDLSRVPVRLWLVRPKTNYQYYSFIGHDAVVCLKDWLNVRATNYGGIKIKPASTPNQQATSDPIYLTKEGRRLVPAYVSVLFNDAGKRAGVNIQPPEKLPRYKGATRQYPFHSHEVRDTLVTLGRRAGVDQAIVNFFVGHNIDEYGYDKSPYDDPEHFRREYVKLSAYLNIITGKETVLKAEYERRLEGEVKKRDERLAEMQTQLDQLRSDAEEFRYIMEALKQSHGGQVTISKKD
jgi:site-specific recombinase XerC